MSATHRIRRQRWQVSTSGAADAFALRAALRRENELSLLPALERVFAEFDDARREIHLPRLELSVRISAADKMAEELPAALADAVRRVLAEALAKAPEEPPGELAGTSPAGRLRHYLETGQLDWYDAQREPAEVRRLLRSEAMRWSAVPDTAWAGLSVILPADGAACVNILLRFLQLLDEDARSAWAVFTTRQAEMLGGTYPVVLLALDQLQAGRPADHAWRLQALGLLLLSEGRQEAARQIAAWSDALRACADVLGTLNATEQRLWQSIERLGVAAAPPAAAHFDRLTGEPAAEDQVAADRVAADQAGEGGRPMPSPPQRSSEPALGLALRSAGLVLLHPFLLRLFSALGWVDAAHPPSQAFPAASLGPAAALLNWLATGRDEAFECELGTAKLLLGLHPDDALPVGSGLLGEKELAEGEALLTAVLAHWPALGKTSIDGFRVSFLQRGGLLYPAADGWLLRPQAESYDILLDRLPWGLAVIRLPWMRSLLHTEWSPS